MNESIGFSGVKQMRSLEVAKKQEAKAQAKAALLGTIERPLSVQLRSSTERPLRNHLEST